MGFFDSFRKSKSVSENASGGSSPTPEDASAKTLVEYGVKKARARDFLGAIKDFDRAIQMDPYDPVAFIERSKAKSELRDKRGADLDLKRAGELLERSDKAFAAFDSGLAKYNSDDYHGAITDLDTAIALGLNITQPFHIRALSKYMIDDYDGAFLDFEEVVKRDPQYSADVYYYRGRIKVQSHQDAESAIADYSKAIELDPEYVDAYYSRATLMDANEACDDLSAAIKLAPSEARLYFARSVRRSSLGDYNGAIADLDIFIACNPSDSIASVSEAYSLRGSFKCVQNDLVSALDDQDIAVKLEPLRAKAFADRGLTKFLMKDYKGSISDLNCAIELDCSDGESFHWRGLAKHEIGLSEEGREDVQQAIDLGYAD